MIGLGWKNMIGWGEKGLRVGENGKYGVVIEDMVDFVMECF